MKGSSGNKQPFKEITYQDIYSLKMTLEQLQSWNEALEVIKDFFDNEAVTLNKKKIMREFHAQARIFQVFYENFLLSTDSLEKKIDKLGSTGIIKKW